MTDGLADHSFGFLKNAMKKGVSTGVRLYYTQFVIVMERREGECVSKGVGRVDRRLDDNASEFASIFVLI